MDCWPRNVLLLATLWLLAGPLFAGDTIEFKPRLIPGKKYYTTSESAQTTTLGVGEIKVEETITTTVDFSEAVRPRDDGQPGKRVTLKYEHVAAELSTNSSKSSFDSSKPADGQDSIGLGAIYRHLVGKETHFLLDSEDKVTKAEGNDALDKALDSAVPGVVMSRIFANASNAPVGTKYVVEDHLPDHPVKPGDTWPLTGLTSPKGKPIETGTCTFKGMVDRDGVRLAEMAFDGKISSEFGDLDALKSAIPGVDKALGDIGMKTTGGIIKGTVWFDPKLGYVTESESTREITMTMKNIIDDKGTLTIPTKQTIHRKLTRVEDLPQ